jgi:putative transposase
MSNNDPPSCSRTRWAQFRFSVVGSLLAAPPQPGELQKAIKTLARKRYKHPITKERVRFGFSTIERWYYKAQNARTDPVGELRRKVRKDLGQHPAMPMMLRPRLAGQYKRHPSWTYQLHADNLEVIATDELKLERTPSYPTVRRYMKATGMFRRRRRGPKDSPGGQRAEQRFETHEVRSFESTHVHGLWHLDFHCGSRRVLTADGHYKKPQLLGVLDDRSRLCCHLQWYLSETAENLVHGLSQAFQKRRLPRALLTDNGSAMTAAETVQGLGRLSVLPDTTLPYSPEQNGKQECFWAQVEGRVMAMLEDVEELSLSLLNEATLAWMELEYNRKVHSEIGTTPLTRYLEGPDVGRDCPGAEMLRQRFCKQEGRSQRRSDGTVSIKGVRFEIPSRYRNLQKVAVRYARWDLSRVWLVDGRTDTVLCRIYPLDRERNADGRRRRIGPIPDDLPEPTGDEPGSGVAPLLKKLMADYAHSGLPPAYLPKDDITPAAGATDTEQEQDHE